MGSDSKARNNTARTLRVLLLIAAWMVISISLIMYNKWLLSYKNYRFPLAMTLSHQFCTALLAHATCRLGFMTPPQLTPQQLQSRILPIALLFAASIALSNLAVSYLTVPFMQMLKASIPTFSLVLGVLTGVEAFDVKLLGCVLGIGAGVAVASVGELDFVPVGFAIAVLGLVTEAARLVLTQKLLQGQDIKFNAITGNYYTAPIAFLALAGPFLFFESSRWWAQVDVGVMWPHIVANGCMAALLNVSVFVVLKETGAVTYGIAGQVKDWLNIFIAIPVFGTAVSGLQLKGYALAVAMVFYYKRVRESKAQEAKAEAEQRQQRAEAANEEQRLRSDGEAEQQRARRAKAAHYSPEFDHPSSDGESDKGV